MKGVYKMFRVRHDHYHHLSDDPPQWVAAAVNNFERALDRIERALKKPKLSAEDQKMVDEIYTRTVGNIASIDDELANRSGRLPDKPKG